MYMYISIYRERESKREGTVKCIPEQGIVMYHKCITKIPVIPLAFLRKPDLSNSVCFVRPSEK